MSVELKTDAQRVGFLICALAEITNRLEAGDVETSISLAKGAITGAVYGTDSSEWMTHLAIAKARFAGA